MFVDKWLETLHNNKIISEHEVKQLCNRVKEIFMEESNVQPVSAPVIICGDIHGQYYDLLSLFETGGEIPKSTYIFMGDYVDRGYNSVETVELLLCLKLKYPGHITLLRGNHESRQICYSYGFYEEITKKYGNGNPWKYFTDIFDYMPIGAIVEGKIFCVHGGLSPFISSIDQIRLLNRKQEIPYEGAFCDLMWSDPDDTEGWLVSNRGAGYIFGWRVVSEFNHINDLILVARAHQLVQQGYKFWFRDKNLVTVWSAPNYCYRCGNEASIMKVDDNLNTEFLSVKVHPESNAPVSPKDIFVPYFL
jgi:serine/threonine-protein phosphatase 6 catalytic subunit